MKLAPLSAVLATLVAVSLFGASTISADAKSIEVKMEALNGSGETGYATLTDLPFVGLKVVIHLNGAPKDVPQPTHIHVGTCGNINKAPEYPLSNTVNGQSTSTVKGVYLKTLMGGKFAINVHKSTDDIATYVSCGNIKG